MDTRRLCLVVLIVSMIFSSEMMGQQKKAKSTRKLTQQYVNYVMNKDNDKEKLAQKNSSDPATVTRDSASNQKQKTFEDVYNEFSQQAKADYNDFRNQANRDYAEFVRKAWKEYKVMPAISKPKEERVPPVVIEEDIRNNPIEDKPLPVKDDIIPPLPAPEPQPVPIAPIKEQPKPVDNYISFTLYGTNLKVRFSDNQRFTLKSCSNNDIAEAWELLSGTDYNNIIRDCLEIRIKRQLSDWAYLNMLHKMTVACLGNSNEATLLMAFIYCQSGYQMRMGISNNRLVMLYSSEHSVFDKPYFVLDGKMFCMYMSDEKSLKICNISFPNEKPMSLLIPKEQIFDYVASPQRTLRSRDYPNMAIQSSVNKNALAFYNTYPSSMLYNNVVTRWSMYANMPLSENLKKELLPVLQEKIKGLSQLDAMQRLLNFVQTAFEYEYDDKVWGHDRAFFPEETLYYPYCDCEDRSILLSRIVRDLLGLKCILIFYPGHLAMAVHFTEDVKGDYIMLNGLKFTVCDPTYIGAPVGKTMPDMNNQTAQVILLE